MSGKLYQVQNGQKVDVTPMIAALTDTTSKADVTLGNLTTAGKAAMTQAAMPSTQYIDLTVPAYGTEITAPDDGWIYAAGNTNQNNGGFALHIWDAVSNQVILGTKVDWPTSGRSVYIYIPVKKGQRVRVAFDGTATVFRLIYANGSVPQP